MVLKSYADHKPAGDCLENIRLLRQAFSDLDELLVKVVPPGRERSVAITQLETAAMWTIKALIINDPDSVVVP